MYTHVRVFWLSGFVKAFRDFGAKWNVEYQYSCLSIKDFWQCVLVVKLKFFTWVGGSFPTYQGCSPHPDHSFLWAEYTGYDDDE